jgi:uncharacterized membrane protein YfcA
MKILESFLFILLAELFLTFYAIHSAKGKGTTAGIFAALNTLLYCMNIQNIIIDNWCIASSMVGAFLGTWISVKISKIK